MQDRARRKDAGAADLLEERQDAVAILTLNRPEARNSLSLGLLRELGEAVPRLSADPDVRAVVLAGNGPAFSAGHDLKELTAHRVDADGGLAFYRTAMETCAGVMRAILSSPKPFIAAVHATATAAGCQLVATCDLAVAAEEAELATPGVNIGLFCSTPMVALTRNVPRKRAMEMLLLGEVLPARVAAEHGLVNRVVPRARVLDEALAMARQIAAKSPLVISIGKEAFYRQIEMPTAEAYRYAAEVMVENMMARDAAEGIGAFIDKRNPAWKGC
ncbi:MAG: enoyl-CoA hydratase [Hyphomicrobiaceae bacterium]|nr:enoyl-CoA hydratase [Hyphomicrobiaceae bacterium]